MPNIAAYADHPGVRISIASRPVMIRSENIALDSRPVVSPIGRQMPVTANTMASANSENTALPRAAIPSRRMP